MSFGGCCQDRRGQGVGKRLYEARRTLAERLERLAGNLEKEGASA